MFNIFRSIASFFGYDTKAETLPKQEEGVLINTTLSIKTPSLLFSENIGKISSCTGKITFISNSVAVIDENYYFPRKCCISPDLFVGDLVQFKLHKSDVDTFIDKVEKINKEVIFEEFSQDQWNSNISILRVTGIVTKKIGRNVYVTGEEGTEVTFNLDRVSSEFIPAEGDIVILEGDSQTLENVTTNDENHSFAVKKIKPKHATIKYGIVSSRTDNYGIINNFAVFSLDCCEPGFVPETGDQVLASLIRVNNKNGYQWRAIQVVHRFQKAAYAAKFTLKDSSNEYFKNKCEIIIPVLSKFVLDISSSNRFTVEIENTNIIEAELLAVFSNTYNSCSDWRQVSLVSPKNTHIVLKPKTKILFVFEIKAKFIGYSCDEYVWKFSGFSISRLFELDVTSNKCKGMISNLSTKQSHNPLTNVTALNLLDQTSGDIMPGQKKYLSCRMYPVQLGEFALPKNILTAALPPNRMKLDDILLRVEQVLPCLKEELSPRTYLAHFSGLLFLEEIERLKQMAELSIEKACFRRAGKYLILKVPQFSAYANRLISGDKAIASLPWNFGISKFEGIIHRLTATEIWLQFSRTFHESYLEGTQLSLSFVTSRVSLRRMHQAVSVARKFLGDTWLFPTGVESSLRAIFQEVQQNGNSKKNSKINWNRHGSGYGRHCTIQNVVDLEIDPKIIKQIKWFNKLNNEQKEATYRILMGEARPLPYVIFGPPGTGKTMTVVETILQIYNSFSNSRILAVTPSNSAADLLTERLLEVGNLAQKDILRLAGLNAVEQGKIVASLMPYVAVADPKDLQGCDNDLGVQALGRDALSQFRVIVSTIGSIGMMYNLGFPRGYYSHIFIDEAGQLSEPEILTVLVLLNIKNGHVILAGDPFQLGPVVCSEIAKKFGLQESLLSRLLDRFPYKKDSDGFPDRYGCDPRLVTKLVNNYRSIPVLLQLTNMLFYDGDLIANVSEKSSQESILLQRLSPWLPVNTSKGTASSFLFHGVQGINYQENNSSSWYNPQEAYQVFYYLNLLYEAGLSPDHVGIITPYQLQGLKIREMLEQLNIEPPKIGSVEEFQGQERMIIILTVVRSNLDVSKRDTPMSLGFVRDPKRLNVAISRARAVLILIGNPHFLYHDKLWKKILKYCVANSCYIGCDLPLDL